VLSGIRTAGSNTVTFQNPIVTISQIGVRSQSGPGIIATKHIYTIRGWLEVTAGASGFQRAVEDIRLILSAPRGDFSVFDGDSTLFASSPNRDVAWGPIPTVCYITRIVGTQIVRVEWQLETTVKPVYETSRGGAEALDLVYSISASLDENFYSTRTQTGVLLLDSRHMTGTLSPDSYRLTVYDNTCKCPAGWRRIVQDFQSSTDRTRLAFTIVDRQTYCPLPQGISAGSVSVSVNQNPVSCWCTWRVRGYYEAPTYHPSQEAVLNEAGLRNVTYEAFAGMLSQLLPAEGAKKYELLRLWASREIYRNRLDFDVEWELSLDPQLLKDQGKPLPKWTSLASFIMQKTLLGWVGRWIDEERKSAAKFDRFRPLSGYGTTSVSGFCGTGTIQPVLSIYDRRGLYNHPSGYPDTMKSEGRERDTETSLADQHEAYQEYSQTYDYDYDAGVVVLPVKVINTAPVIQRVKPAVLTLSIDGHSTSSNLYPPQVEFPGSVSESLGGTADWTVLSAKIRTHTTTANERYKAEWKYKLQKVTDGIPETVDLPKHPLITPETKTLALPAFTQGDDVA